MEISITELKGLTDKKIDFNYNLIKGKLDYDLFINYPFPLTHILFVTKKKIKITTVSKIEEQIKKKKTSHKIFEDLHETTLINFSDDQRIIIKQFYKFVEYFFANLPTNKEAKDTLSEVLT